MNANVEMRIYECSCGITWAAPEAWAKNREDDHATFFCPNGCRRVYSQDNEEEKLRRQLKAEKKCCQYFKGEAESTSRTVVALKGHITRLKNKLGGEA